MRCKKTITCTFGLICLASVLAFGQQKQSARHFFNIGSKPSEFEVFKIKPSFQTPEISESIVYQQLFRLILSFEREADKQTNTGHLQRADFLRSYFQTKARLTSEQSSTLKNYAGSFGNEVKKIEKRYETARQAKNENLFLLDKLARERNQLLLEYRNRLRNVLGENSFENLDKFLQEKIALHIVYREDPITRIPSITQSLIDYDARNDEVCGYSVTDEVAGRGGRDSVVNIVHATLESDLDGVVDEQEYEECNQSAEVYLYASGPRPNEGFCVMGEHQYAIVPILLFADEKFDNNSLKSTDTPSNRGCYYEKSENLPDTQDCLTIPPLPNVTGVSFQLIQPGSTAIDTNPNAEGGLRIFPDDDTPGDMTNRRRIRVTAGLSEQVAGKTVYFRNFDLDDPSTDMTIDPNGTTENDNNGNVNGSSAGQLSAMSASTNSRGVASVEFTVTMQPGDNFAIAAGTNQNEVSNVSVDGTALISGSGASIDTNCDGTDAVCRSEMLTVWRRLHIEVDSMGLATQNFVRGTITDTGKVGTGNQTLNLSVNNLKPNRFENGRIVLQGTTTRSFPVIDATFSGGTVINSSNSNSSVTFRNNGSLFSVRNGDLFTLYDDDDMDDEDSSLNGDDGDDVRPPETSLIEDSDTNCPDVFNANNCNVFANAYVRPKFDIGRGDNSSFNVNADNGLIESYRNLYFQNRPTQASETFWTIYLNGIYQFEEAVDGDPDESRGTLGRVDSLLGIGEGAAISIELNRSHESFSPIRPVGMRFTVAHEVGHLFDGRHDDFNTNNNAGLMAQTTNRDSAVFNSVTINKIRGGQYTDSTGTTRRITHP